MTPLFRHPAHFAAIAFVVTLIFQSLAYMHPDVNFSIPWIFIPAIFMAAVAYAVAWFVLRDDDK